MMLYREETTLRKLLKRILTWSIAMFVAGLALVLGINALVFYPGRSLMVAPEGAEPAEAILVLGALVFPDGRPSAMVQDRLDTAYDLYQAGKAPKILLTGDHGQVEYDEVNAMRRYLEAKGVPGADIFMDHAGFDTYDSMYRARDVFQARRVLVVTQRFHLPRALWIADRLGLTPQGVIADRQRYLREEFYEWREMAARIKAFGEVVVHRKPVYLGPVIPIDGDGRATHDQPI